MPYAGRGKWLPGRPCKAARAGGEGAVRGRRRPWKPVTRAESRALACLPPLGRLLCSAGPPLAGPGSRGSVRAPRWWTPSPQLGCHTQSGRCVQDVRSGATRRQESLTARRRAARREPSAERHGPVWRERRLIAQRVGLPNVELFPVPAHQSESQCLASKGHASRRRCNPRPSCMQLRQRQLHATVAGNKRRA